MPLSILFLASLSSDWFFWSSLLFLVTNYRCFTLIKLSILAAFPVPWCSLFHLNLNVRLLSSWNEFFHASKTIQLLDRQCCRNWNPFIKSSSSCIEQSLSSPLFWSRALIYKKNLLKSRFGLSISRWVYRF